MSDPIKFSVPDWCFFREQPDPAAYYRKLRELGFTAVEMVDAVLPPCTLTPMLAIALA